MIQYVQAHQKNMDSIYKIKNELKDDTTSDLER